MASVCHPLPAKRSSLSAAYDVTDLAGGAETRQFPGKVQQSVPWSAARYRQRTAGSWQQRSSNELLLDDPDLDLRVDVGVEADLHPIDAQRADRLMELDLALLDLEALRFELVLDIGRRD